MPLDPVTAALELATAITNAYAAFLAAASPTQKERIVEAWLEDRAFLRGLIPPPKKGSD